MKKLILILFFISAVVFSQYERKIALVIGNSNYEDPNVVLQNPTNDSKFI